AVLAVLVLPLLLGRVALVAGLPHQCPPARVRFERVEHRLDPLPPLHRHPGLPPGLRWRGAPLDAAAWVHLHSFLVDQFCLGADGADRAAVLDGLAADTVHAVLSAAGALVHALEVVEDHPVTLLSVRPGAAGGAGSLPAR